MKYLGVLRDNPIEKNKKNLKKKMEKKVENNEGNGVSQPGIFGEFSRTYIFMYGTQHFCFSIAPVFNHM